MATTITAGNGTNGGAAIASDNTGILELKTGSGAGTTAITVNASQNVGVGTSSPGGKLDVRAGTGATLLVAADATNLLSINNYNPTSGFQDFKYVGSTHQFFTGTAGGGSASEQARITSAGLFQFNSGYGSVATAYGCRAWVNFNGTGAVAIRASGNVSSITDNNTGDYTVNFTTAMSDANYASVVTTKDTGIAAIPSGFNRNSAQTTASVRVGTGAALAGSITTTDPDTVVVAIFR